MSAAARHMASMLREAACFIEMQCEEMERMKQDRDALRAVIEELNTQLAIAKLQGVP